MFNTKHATQQAPAQCGRSQQLCSNSMYQRLRLYSLHKNRATTMTATKTSSGTKYPGCPNVPARGTSGEPYGGSLRNAKFVPSVLYNSVFSHFVCCGYQVQIYIFFLLQAKKQKKNSNCSGKRQSTWRRGMPRRHRRGWPAWGRCCTKGNNLGTVFQTFTERRENNFFHVVFFSYLCTH